MRLCEAEMFEEDTNMHSRAQCFVKDTHSVSSQEQDAWIVLECPKEDYDDVSALKLL